MASWGLWDLEPPSEANTVVTGGDFTLVDLLNDETNGRKYGTGSPEPTEHHAHEDVWADPYAPERRPFQHQGPPREVPCLQCANRMMVRGFHGLCRDHLANANGECYCCVLHGVECEEVPETAFKSAYELQVCARKMDEGHEDTDWEYLSSKAELALMKEGLLWFVREDPNDDRDENDHAKEVVNDKVNQADSGNCWDDNSNTNWDGNANVNQIGNDNTSCGGNGISHWGSNNDTAWDDKGNTNWGDESDSNEDWGTESTPDSEVDNDCDDDSNKDQDIESTPESSADRIVAAINRNTDVVADLYEIMDGIKEGLDRLHKDNVQSKKVLQKLLVEQRALNESLG